MIDYHKDLVTALKTILPTHYEMTLTSGTKVPCISYMEIDNAVTANGDTLGYSRLQYQIKVWANDIAVIQQYAMEVDKVLRPLGWTRVGSNEMYDNQSTMIQKIMTYEALASEMF
jgi:hypothetical protein